MNAKVLSYLIFCDLNYSKRVADYLSIIVYKYD